MPACCNLRAQCAGPTTSSACAELLFVRPSVYCGTPGGSTLGAVLQEHGELQAAVELSCVAAGLQPVAPFVHKCLQLHETFGVRFGVMLIGPTGETGCCPVLMSCRIIHCRLHQTVLMMAGQGCAQLQARKCHAAQAGLQWLLGSKPACMPSHCRPTCPLQAVARLSVAACCAMRCACWPVSSTQPAGTTPFRH